MQLLLAHHVQIFRVPAQLWHPQARLHGLMNPVGFGLVRRRILADPGGNARRHAIGEFVVGGRMRRAAAVVLEGVAGPDAGVSFV